MDAGQRAYGIARVTDLRPRSRCRSRSGPPPHRSTGGREWRVRPNGFAVVDELITQLQQLAEADLGVAALHELWEKISDYHR